MSALLRKYGVQADIYFPIPDAGNTNLAQSADWTPATGDTKISKDGGTLANTTNNPAIVAGTNGIWWKLTLTATEMQAAQVMVQIVDSATKAIEDQALLIETYGHASALHAFDLDTATQNVNVTSLSAGAITAAAIATDAIDADALAADAVTEIATAASGGSTAAEIATEILGTTVTEGYPAVGGDPTVAQLLTMVAQAAAGNLAVNGLNLVIYQRDGVTTAMAYSLNDADQPATRTRTS